MKSNDSLNAVRNCTDLPTTKTGNQTLLLKLSERCCLLFKLASAQQCVDVFFVIELLFYIYIMKKSIILTFLFCTCMVFGSVTFASDVGKDKVPKTTSFSIEKSNIVVADVLAVNKAEVVLSNHSTIEAKDLETAIANTEPAKTHSFIPYSMEYSYKKAVSYGPGTNTKFILKNYNGNRLMIELWKDKIKQC